MAKRPRETRPNYELQNLGEGSSQRPSFSLIPQVHINYRCPAVKVVGIVDCTVWQNIKKSWPNILPLKVESPSSLSPPVHIHVRSWMKCLDLEPIWQYMTGSFRSKASAWLTPLSKLKYSDERKIWYTSSEVSFKDNMYVEAFTHNMASSKGRHFIHAMLTHCYDASREDVNIIVENIGGRSRSSDATRFLFFDVTKRGEELSMERPFSRKSPRIEPETVGRCFVPDLVMTSGQTSQSIHEILTVKVQSGSVLLETDKAQLKYMLLPLAMKQMEALGLLICANKAIIMKAWVEGGEVKYGSKTFSFSSDHLAAEMTNIMTEINSHILNYRNEKGI